MKSLRERACEKCYKCRFLFKDISRFEVILNCFLVVSSATALAVLDYAYTLYKFKLVLELHDCVCLCTLCTT